MIGSQRCTRQVAVHRLFDRFGLSRHDVVLALIPTAFLVMLGVGGLLGLTMHARIVGGALLAGLAVVDALFLNPPAPFDRTGAGSRRDDARRRSSVDR